MPACRSPGCLPLSGADFGATPSEAAAPGVGVFLAVDARRRLNGVGARSRAAASPVQVVAIEHPFEDRAHLERTVRRVPGHPDPAWIALRGAALAIDDVSRQHLRQWLVASLNHYGEPNDRYPQPADPATAVIVAGLLRLPGMQRVRWRRWLLRWTDEAGRIVLPATSRLR